MVRELSCPPPGSRQVPRAEAGLSGCAERIDQLVGAGWSIRRGQEQRDPAPRRGCGREGVAGPALGTGERIERGGLGERVACAFSEFDRLFRARERLRYGVRGWA